MAKEINGVYQPDEILDSNGAHLRGSRRKPKQTSTFGYPFSHEAAFTAEQAGIRSKIANHSAMWICIVLACSAVAAKRCNESQKSEACDAALTAAKKKMVPDYNPNATEISDADRKLVDASIVHFVTQMKGDDIDTIRSKNATGSPVRLSANFEGATPAVALINHGEVLSNSFARLQFTCTGPLSNDRWLDTANCNWTYPTMATEISLSGDIVPKIQNTLDTLLRKEVCEQ